jgi:hypothetical protein
MSRKICIATNILKGNTLSISLIIPVLSLLETLHSVVLTNVSLYGPIGLLITFLCKDVDVNKLR